MRKKIIAGNWKMNKTLRETLEYLKDISNKIQHESPKVIIAPPFISLSDAIKITSNANISIAAQNMHSELNGAFTGEISCVMLKEINVDFVLLGHSERRSIFKENNNFINKKVKAALKAKIKPIFCIGETLEEKEAHKTQDVLEEQFKEGLKEISIEDAQNIIIAYEPVWAIGTGKTATTEIAENNHCFIRKLLIKYFDKEIAEKVSILYGGSVKPDNASELLQQENIDGVLVGGASLDVDTFVQIINKA